MFLWDSSRGVSTPAGLFAFTVPAAALVDQQYSVEAQMRSLPCAAASTVTTLGSIPGAGWSLWPYGCPWGQEFCLAPETTNWLLHVWPFAWPQFSFCLPEHRGPDSSADHIQSLLGSSTREIPAKTFCDNFCAQVWQSMEFFQADPSLSYSPICNMHLFSFSVSFTSVAEFQLLLILLY